MHGALASAAGGRRLIGCCALTGALMLAPAPAQAKVCALDVVPAATLLLPYFEVDLEALDQSDGLTTAFTVHNAAPDPAVVHITFWTDYALPTLDFDVFLTGFDVQQFDLREAFRGNLPRTADEQTDPDDAISPHGANPEWDGSFDLPPNCANFFPFDNPVIPSLLLDRLTNGHLGLPILGGDQCLGSSVGDGIARGYITMDNVRRCSLEFPFDPGYFSGVNPVASNDNQLWGEFRIVDRAKGVEIREALVHLEADPELGPEGSTPTGYTFYGAFSGGDDLREPLGSVWSSRYVSAPIGDVETDWIVWRDPTSSAVPTSLSVPCDEPPAWAPLQEAEVFCTDGDGFDFFPCAADGDGAGDPACFPLATQRIAVGSLGFPVAAGLCRFDLNADDSFPGDVDFPGPGSTSAQSYVLTSFSPMGSFEIGFQATAFAGACDLPPGAPSRPAGENQTAPGGITP